jgi:hypothetical protein
MHSRDASDELAFCSEHAEAYALLIESVELDNEIAIKKMCILHGELTRILSAFWLEKERQILAMIISKLRELRRVIKHECKYKVQHRLSKAMSLLINRNSIAIERGYLSPCVKKAPVNNNIAKRQPSPKREVASRQPPQYEQPVIQCDAKECTSRLATWSDYDVHELCTTPVYCDIHQLIAQGLENQFHRSLLAYNEALVTVRCKGDDVTRADINDLLALLRAAKRDYGTFVSMIRRQYLDDVVKIATWLGSAAEHEELMVAGLKAYDSPPSTPTDWATPPDEDAPEWTIRR